MRGLVAAALLALRPGDNLYASSVIALDAGTGKPKWHYHHKLVCAFA
jgi:glucose dehydrogenase